MKIVDLNVLIYAVNRDAPNHGRALEWFEASLSDTETVGLTWVVILGFLRITTNPRIMPRPLSIESAVELIEDWLQLDSIQIVEPTDRHWSILRQILLSHGTASNLTTDAHLAAIAIEKGATLYSCDNDYNRFPNLRWINPI
ncbi:MAG: type II toxin-antitoxin system VapC family toxin [Proteobacteria bacterium]|nr:type II toxin-antitoxin system VapC family toxin [Pseudomonadota bacterium]